MYEINICPIGRMYDIASDGDMDEVALLAVSSYSIDKDKLSGFYDRLFLSFADTSDSGRDDAFNEQIGEKAADFIKSLPKDLDTLFVCCDRGESRSAAMAAAIMRYNGEDDTVVWNDPAYHPNPLVYKLLCSSLGVKINGLSLKYRVWRNKKALSRYIKKLRG